MRRLAGRCLAKFTRYRQERPDRSAEAALGRLSAYPMLSSIPNCLAWPFLSGLLLGEVTVLRRNFRFMTRRSVMSLISLSTGTILSFSMQLSSHSYATNLGRLLSTSTFLTTRKSSSSLAGLTFWILSTALKRPSLLVSWNSTAERKKLRALQVLSSYLWRASRNQTKPSRYSSRLS